MSEYTIYTFVGVSLIKNYMQFYHEKKQLNDIKYGLKDLSNSYNKCLESKNNKNNREKLKNDIKNIEESLKVWLTNVNGKSLDDLDYCDKGIINPFASAEITSILKFVKRKKNNVRVILLTSDTLLSNVMAEVIYEQLNEYCLDECTILVEYNEENNCIKGLQVSDCTEFKKEGLKSFLKFYQDNIGENTYNLYFNITSGYKAFIPYITIMGQVYQFDCFYLFEKQSEIIEIPKLPVKFDESVIEEYYHTFYKIDMEQKADGFNENELKDLKFIEDKRVEALIENIDGYLILSGLGQILWNKWKSKYVLFYAPDKVYQDICSDSKKRIRKILRENDPNSKEWDNHCKSEANGKQVFKKGRTEDRLFYFKLDEKYPYIYKVFSEGQHNGEYDRYNQETKFNNKFREKIVADSTLQKLSKEEENTCIN